eukprot:8432710-Lingulodinium_polyedra.AAC.1
MAEKAKQWAARLDDYLIRAKGVRKEEEHRYRGRMQYPKLVQVTVMPKAGERKQTQAEKWHAEWQKLHNC